MDFNMNYWLDLFTVQTYEEFQKAGAKVSGFRDRQWNRCQRIQPGDKLLCYLTGISRWVGVLTVKGPAFRSTDKIWEMEVFPVRLTVEADILLPPEYGIPHQSLMTSLHSPAKAWAGLLRGSPNLLKTEDGQAIFDAIQKAKQTPVLRPYDKKKAARTPATPKTVDKPVAGADADDKAGLCPWLPTFSQLRGYLAAIDGVSVPALEQLQSSVWGLRGTPQEPVSWDDPEQWIGERLTGDVQALAKHVWSKSKETINPRYMRGPAIVADRYELAEESTDGKWAITAAGRELLEAEFGATEKGIDLQEGMAEIMQIVQAKPNSRRGDLVPEWREFVVENSNIQQESVVKDFLYRRLQNLMDRKLVDREGQRYRLTKAGEDYLQVLSSDIPGSQARSQELLRGVDTFNRSQRELLRERLENMNPYAFEQLICDLLTEMGYEDVEVTQPSNDKGVDVKAVAQFGITTINEVIQVKRHQANVQRPVLDMLRGSLHRFKAQKGTIITIGDFGKGAKDSAFEMGAAPITLINGDTLIDLLIQHQIGVKKKAVEYFEVDEKVFQAVPDGEADAAEDQEEQAANGE
jgi:restriction system protein